MSEEKTALNLLIDYAKQTEREATYGVKDLSTFSTHHIFMHARTIWFRDKQNSERIFAAYSNPKVFGFQSVFSGVFIPTKAPKETVLMIRRKIFTDCLNAPFRPKIRFNDKKLDRKLIVSGTVTNDDVDLLHNAKIHQALFDFTILNPSYRIVLNDLNMKWLPQFQNKSYLGLVRMGWETTQKIEDLFEHIKHFEMRQ